MRIHATVLRRIGILLRRKRRNNPNSTLPEENALLSRLRAHCKNNGCQWSTKDTTVDLARRLMDESPKAWNAFSDKYKIVFYYDSGEFVELRDMASILGHAERSQYPNIRRLASKIRKDLRSVGLL